MRAALYHLREQIDLAVCFTPTEETRLNFERLVPPCMVFDNLDLKIVESALETQKQLLQRGKERAPAIGEASWARTWARGARRLSFRRSPHMLTH